jgi:peptidoglycan/LPS O-acetylase OafA/YrhL
VSTKNRLPYLDGLKGLAIIAVVFLHYADGFYPSLEDPSTNSLHQFIAESPVRLIYNGFFSVFIFFLISSYIIGYQYFHDKKSFPLIPSIFKRYLRLVFVVLVTSTIAYLLLKFSLFRHLVLTPITHGYFQYYYTFPADFLSMLYSSFVSTFIFGANPYNIPLWFLTQEFIGSSIVFCVLYFFGKTQWRYLVYLLLLYPAWKYYYMMFLLGVVISDLQVRYEKHFNRLKNSPVLIVLLLIAIVLGSYPLAEHITSSQGNLFSMMTLGNDYILSANIYWGIAAICILICTLYFEPLQQILSTRPFTFIGKLSFTICAVHFILACSFSSALFLFLLPFASYHIAALLMFLISMPLIIVLSLLIHQYIEIPSIQFSQYLASRLSTSLSK